MYKLENVSMSYNGEELDGGEIVDNIAIVELVEGRLEEWKTEGLEIMRLLNQMDDGSVLVNDAKNLIYEAARLYAEGE